MPNTFRFLLAIAVSSAASCGGGTAEPVVRTTTTPDEPPPATAVHERGDEIVVTLTRAGGTLELNNGFRIEIPAGAVTEPVEVRFTRGHEANVFSREEGEYAAGEIAELNPVVIATEGMMFTVSAPIGRLPAELAEAQVVLGMEEETRGRTFGDAVTTRWQYHPARRGDGRFEAEVTYLGGHRLQFGLLHGE